MAYFLQTPSLRKLLILSAIILVLTVSPAAAFGPLGDAFRVNTYLTNLQGYPSIAADHNGNFVVVWHSNGQDGNSDGVYGQRYNAAGVALGSEFPVNTTTTGQQRIPEIAMDSDGDFVVLWADTGVGVKFQRYNASGVAQGGETTVGSVTNFANSIAIAMDNDGDFVVVWVKPDNSTNARLYNAAGVAQTSEFVLTVGLVPRVAMDAVGNFIVSSTSGGNSVVAQRYNAAGAVQGSSITVGTGSYSSVAADDSGNFVIAWQNSQTVTARCYNASGTALAAEFQVNTTLDTNIGNARIAMNSSGAFVVGWERGASATDAYIRSYNASGQAMTGEIIVSSASDYQGYVFPAIDVEGILTVAYMSNEITPTDFDVYVRRFSDAVPPEFRVNNLTPQYQSQPDVAMDSSGNFVITWESDLIDGSSRGIAARRYNAAAVAQGNQFTVNTTTNLAQETPAIAMNATGGFVIVWGGYEGTGSNDDIFAQRFNAAGTPQGVEFRVNTTTTGNQINPAIAMDSTGNFVVVWQTEGSATPINAQRYNASGVAQGSEFRVDTLTSTSTSYPAVAMNSTGFIVTWATLIAANTDVYARRYNSAGVAQGIEFIVNTTTPNTQSTPSIAVNASGNFVIVWGSSANDFGDIYGQRYNSAGAVLGTEFPVNTTTEDVQDAPDVSMDSDGDFVVVWATWDTVGDINVEVYAQRYNSDGSPFDDEFQVNVSTDLPQFLPAAVMDSTETVIVTWMHEVRSAPTPPDDDIYARRIESPSPLLVSPTALTYDALQGSGLTSPQTITIENTSDDQTFSFTVNSLPSWLTCTAPGTSTLSPNTSTTIDCRANTGVLTPQTYNGVFQVTPDNDISPRLINVSFTVNAPPPVLSVSPLSLSYTATEGNGLTAAQTVTISNTASGSSSMNFAVGTLPSWLTCTTPATNLLAGGTNTTISCRANTGALTPQTYNDNFQITSNTVGVTGSPQTVNVAFTVNANTPVLRVAPTTLTFTAPQGTGQTDTQAIAIDNIGAGDSFLTFAIGSLPTWLTCTAPSTTTLNGGTGTSILCHANTGVLMPQTYNGSFQVTSSTVGITGSPQTVNVSFVVTLPPTLLAITENDFFAAFQQERAAYLAIAQGIADFVPGGINMTVTLNTGEVGRVNFTVVNADGFVTIQIASITTLSGGAASQNYLNIINRDLPSLLTAALDNILVTRFGSTQNVESLTIDNSTMTLTVIEG